MVERTTWKTHPKSTRWTFLNQNFCDHLTAADFWCYFWAWLWRGGLEPDKACSDYPHANSLSDKCIEEALGLLANQETKAAVGPSSTPMPYRWVPYSERRLWASGSYWLQSYHDDCIAWLQIQACKFQDMHHNLLPSCDALWIWEKVREVCDISLEMEL